MGKSIRTEDWKNHLFGYFKDQPNKIQALDSIDWDVRTRVQVIIKKSPTERSGQAWFYGEGTELPIKLEFDTTLAVKAYALAKRWDAARSTDIPQLDFKETDLQDFDANQVGRWIRPLISGSIYSSWQLQLCS